MAGGAGTGVVTGVMLTKVLAARRAARSGADTVIASGRQPDVLARLLSGESVGTRLRSGTAPMAARKQWLADHLQTRGSLVLDDGAARALAEGGRSLLAVGVRTATGEFERGEVVDCRDSGGRLIARGLVNYSATETRRIMGKPSSEIEGVLGYINEPALIHRDNLVLL
jgi:glutamate 5-kinase